MTDDGLDRLIERLDRLERADRRRTLTSPAIAMLLVAGIGFAAAAPRNRPPGRRPWDRRSVRSAPSGSCSLMTLENFARCSALRHAGR